MLRRKTVGIGMIVVVLFVFGFSQLQAQSLAHARRAVRPNHHTDAKGFVSIQ